MAFLNPEPSKKKGVAFYKCPICLFHWKKKNSKGGESDCENEQCMQSGIRPYDFRQITVVQKPRVQRMFGQFKCGCGNSWPSAYAWVTMPGDIRKKQQCRDCDAWVRPHVVDHLRHSGGSPSQAPHDSERCEQCIECGGDCRTYRPPEQPSTEVIVREDDIPDDESILSIISPAPSLSGDDDDDNRDVTPVGSDTEEDVDELLSGPLKKLSMK